METLVTATLEVLDELHDDLRRMVSDLSAEALNWAPGDETNSIYALVTHLLGSERFWLAAALQQSIERDREAEFRARGADASDLLRLIDEAGAQARALLAQLTPESLAGAFTLREVPRSGASCLLHALEHAGQHRGQIALTRQLWEQRH